MGTHKEPFRGGANSMKKLKKFSLKSVLSLMLALCITVVSILSSSTIGVSADASSSATKRVTNFISLAAGKQVQSDLNDALSLTQDELRFLGVYLSNFYIPFGTELGTTEEDKNTQTADDIKTALHTSLNFSDDMAEIFTDTIMGLSRSNCQELEFRVSKSYHKDYKTVDNMKLNYYNFLRMMVGDTKAVFEGYLSLEDKIPTIIQDIIDKKYEYGYFGYVNNGEFVPMFDCSLTMHYFTPSQYAFLQCLGSVDLEKGYGMSFFDFTEQEAKDESTLAEMLKDMNEDDIYKMSIYGTTVNVDCFGNIILKGGNHQYVAVPGCMNPYTWVSVDSSGNDVYKPGTCYNMVSFQGLGLADTDNLVITSTTLSERPISKDSDNEDLKWATIDSNLYVNNLETVRESYGDDFNEAFSRGLDYLAFWRDKLDSKEATQYETEGYSLRMIRGSTDVQPKSKWTLMDTDYSNLIEKAESGFKSANPDDLTYYASINGGFEQGWLSTTYTITNRVALWGAYANRSKDRSNGLRGDAVRIIDNFAFIDNLGAFGFDNSSSSVDYNAINFDHYLDDDGTSPNQLFSNWGKDAANGFTNMYKDIQAGKMNTTVTADAAAIVGVYTTYAFAGLYENTSDSKSATIGKLGFRLNTDGMIPIANDPINIPSDVADSIIDTSIRNWSYYILHPTQGLEYFRILVKNKVNSLLLGLHNDILGTNGVGSTTGTTLYRSNTGYVTTPDLSELEWTNALIQFYQDLIPYLIVLIIVTMILSYVAGVLSLQRCALGAVVFACFLLTPVNLINGVVSLSNRVTQNIYGDKFTYWALVQQESYANALDEVASGDSYTNYLKTLYATNHDVYSNQGSDSIVLKWQAPKKMASLMISASDQTLLDNLSSTRLIGAVLNNNAYSGESYLDGESSYMYRSYTDLGNFSRFIYNGISNGTQDSSKSISSASISNVNDSLKSAIKNMNATYESDRNAGYANKNGDGSKSTSGEIRTIVPLTSSMYNDAIAKKGTVKKMGINDFVGIHQDAFNFSVAMFNNSSEDYKDNLLANANDNSKDDLSSYLNGYTDADITGLAAYSLMSESPYYYFSWDLYDSGLSTNASATNGYKNLLLGQDNGGYFYNTSGNGELKDFMDMRSLFTYIIPYLKEGNDLVKEWDNVYGTSIYEGVPTEEGHWNDADIKNSKVLQQKYWHNLNVARLYEIYTPWVDLMYDCSYAEPETIKVMGEKYVVSDPINPASYPENRPMIFSESEMTEYGLTESDLTKVERLILKCNKGFEDRMYELLNYYNFSDFTLNTAAAINCTFEFNINFSENGIFKNNINLYPQSFEISDFSYDAFLRFIVSNTIGTDMTTTGDFYEDLINNSSSFTGVVLIALDVVSQYVLPAFKIFFLIAVFIGSVLLILVTVFKIDPEQKFIVKLGKNLVVPMLWFLFTTVGFAWIISLFMGTGNNAVTQTNTLSISMGDPVVVMFAVLGIDIGVLYIYYKITKGIVINIKNDFKTTIQYLGGIVGGATAVLGGVVGKSLSKLSGGRAGGNRDSNITSEGIGRSSIGREAPRATTRGNSNVAEDKADNFSQTRMNDTKRSTIKSTPEKETKESTERKKNNLNDKTSKGLDKVSKEESSRSESNKVKELKVDRNKGKE